MTVCEIVPPATRKELIPAIPRCVRPWEINRYALLNWWDMERFAAVTFTAIGEILTRIGEKLENGAARGSMFSKEQLSEGLIPLIEDVGQRCESIGLKLSAWCANDLVLEMQKSMLGLHLRERLTELNNSIQREMRSVAFFYMPPDQADFYDQKELFGTEVNAKFPSIQFDMVEAGNCYAMGRGTACVFHLMRIMEVGTQELGKRLGVGNVHEKNWQNILDEVNKKIKALPSKGADTVALSEAAAHLYSVKLAWRNEVMHPNDKYTLEEAKDLIQHVRLFMRKLAYII